jgi:myo-inositol-1(or 4)-monophosphatase
MKASFKKIAIDAALKSGLFIKDSVGRVERISYKGRINVVTDIDRKAEDIIIRRIAQAFPEHSFLSEERPPHDKGSPYRWVIDPLDGTTNFVHSFPFFCVSIALEKDAKVVLGVVYDPIRNELFTAESGEGAFLNKKRLHVSATASLSKSLLATGFAYGVKKAVNKNIRNFRNFLVRAMAVRRAGSAALDLCYVACGRFDGFWELSLNPWDTAAASIIVKEAKGLITKFDGTIFTPYEKEILASNRRIHSAMVKVLSS